VSDRDRRRPGDPLHPPTVIVSDLDSRDDVTPVEALRRIEGKIDAARIAADIDADLPEHFARVTAIAKAADAKATEALQAWKWPRRIVGILSAGSFAALAFIVAKIWSGGYEARRSEQHIQAVEQMTKDWKQLREETLPAIRLDIVRLQERLSQWRPLRTVPVIGPHNDKDE
jgi:hypothetical protein